MYYEFGGLTSFAVAAAEATTGRQISAANSKDGKAWIDYRGPPETFRNVPFSLVLRGKVPASVFRGKTVVIGATAPSLQDQHATSTTGDELMSGPEVQANSIWTAIHGFPLSSSATVLDLILILLFAAAPAAATLRLKPPPALRRGRPRARLRARHPARLRRRHGPAGRLPAAGAGPLGARRARRQLPDHQLRAPARA